MRGAVITYLRRKLTPWKIYSFIFGGSTFFYLGNDVDVLIEQMIKFGENLPSEWQQKFIDMRSETGRSWEHLLGKLIINVWVLLSEIYFHQKKTTLPGKFFSESKKADPVKGSPILTTGVP